MLVFKRHLTFDVFFFLKKERRKEGRMGVRKGRKKEGWRVGRWEGGKDM